MITFRCRRRTFPQFLCATDFLLLQEQQGFGHLFQVVVLRPTLVSTALALGKFRLNVH